MGFSGRFVFRRGSWVDGADSEDGDLTIDVHDSDIATVAYEPSTGQGFFYLGFQPRDYFEDEDASAPFDLDAEAAAFAAWANEVLGVEIAAAQVRPLLAEDEQEQPDDDFVEETVARLLSLLRLPLPPGIPAGQTPLADDEHEQPDDNLVEETAARLLSLLRLPHPPGLEPPPE